MVIGSLLDLIALLAAGRWLLPQVRRFLEAHGRVEANYRGSPIPVGLGALLWLLLAAQEAGLLAAVYLFDAEPAFSAVMAVVMGPIAELAELESRFRVFLLAATVVFFIGWTDDLIGDRVVKGLRGHYRYWRQTGTLSMGGVKALAVGCASVWLAAAGHNETIPIWRMGITALVLALMTNALNLMDVRPGRALKAYGTGVVALLLAAGAPAALMPMLPVCVGGLLLFRHDVQARGMLGDAGANLLGFTLGYGAVMTLPTPAQVCIGIFLIYVHRRAERVSLTRLIEQNRMLDWLDRLGRT